MKEPWSPSWRTSLTALALVSLGLISYSSYKLFVAEEELFIPLWITGTHRRPYSTELDCQKFIDIATQRLQDRLSLDEVATNLLGIAVRIDKDDSRNQVKVFARTKSPGIAGFSCNPKTRTWGLSWQPFARLKSNNSNVGEPMTPDGEASNNSDNPGDGNDETVVRPSTEVVREAVIEGSLHVTPSSISALNSIDSAFVEFRATQNIDLPADTPSFTSTTLVYSENGRDFRQRLW